MTDQITPQTISERLRTGRRELRSLLAVARPTHHAERGVQRAQAKRLAGISARQFKKRRKLTKRWILANTPWFGAEAAARVGDKRIPVVEVHP